METTEPTAAVGLASSVSSRVPAGRSSAARWVQGILSIALLAGYAWLSHYSSMTPGARGIATGLCLAPVLLIGLLLSLRWVGAWVTLALMAAAAGAVYGGWAFLESHYEWADLIEQCSVYALLAISFARTLKHGRVPLCTEIEARLYGELTPAEIAYTRLATIGWAAFYALLSLAIVAVFCLRPPAAWSFFVNFTTFGLIALACLADYGVRRRLLAPRSGGGLLSMLRRSLIG